MFTTDPTWRLADLRLSRDLKEDSLLRAGHSPADVVARLADVDQQIRELEEQELLARES